MSYQFMDAYCFGELLRERRRQLGLSQAEVASQVGASRQWVIDIEKGKERAELGMAFKLAQVLGVQFKAQVKTVRPAKAQSTFQHQDAEQAMQDLAAAMDFLDE